MQPTNVSILGNDVFQISLSRLLFSTTYWKTCTTKANTGLYCTRKDEIKRQDLAGAGSGARAQRRSGYVARPLRGAHSRRPVDSWGFARELS